MDPARLKEELPFATAADIEAAVAQFAECSLAHRHWTHRAHLAVALVYCRRYAFPAALERLRARINAYNHHNAQSDGYNETITALFLRKIHAEQCGSYAPVGLPKELARLATLCTVTWAYEYYSPERLWSEEAKQQFLPPDLRALDF